MNHQWVLMALLLASLGLTGFSKAPEEALKELEQLGIPFTEDRFVDGVVKGDIEIVKIFLAAGMSPDAKDRFGISAIYRSLCCISMMQYLLDAGADVNVRDLPEGKTPLIEAVRQGNLAMAMMLVSKGADVNATYVTFGRKQERSALQEARLFHRKDIEAFLIQAGATDALMKP